MENTNTNTNVDTQQDTTEAKVESIKSPKKSYKHNMWAFYSLFLDKLPFLKEYKPLAVGVMEQIQQALWSDQQTAALFSKTILRRIMAIHTNRNTYLKAVIESNQRYNLDGTPADINDNGAIKENEIMYSQQRLKEVEVIIEERKKRKELEKLEKEKEQKRKQAEYFKKLREKKLAEEANKIIQKNKEDDKKFASIVKTKTKQKFKLDLNSKDSNISKVDNTPQAAEVAEKAVKKTLTLKGKLKLKPKKDDDNK